jgi:hypothetical protein
MATIGQKEQFIYSVREAVKLFMLGVDQLRAMRKEWDQQLNAVIIDADFVGDNVGIVKVDIANVVGTTLDTFETSLSAGHGTNLYKVIKRI